MQLYGDLVLFIVLSYGHNRYITSRHDILVLTSLSRHMLIQFASLRKHYLDRYNATVLRGQLIRQTMKIYVIRISHSERDIIRIFDYILDNLPFIENYDDSQKFIHVVRNRLQYFRFFNHILLHQRYDAILGAEWGTN